MTSQLRPEMPVDAADGHVGRLADVVVDPVARTVTHLVVRRAHALHPRSHLVPVAVATVEGEAERLRLTWTRQQLEDSEPIDETDFVELGGWPRRTEEWDVGVVRVLSWPHFPATGRLVETAGPEDTDTLVEFDHLPRGTVELRRESEVFSSDHTVLGHVQGLLVDDRHAITHLVVRRHTHGLGHHELRVPVQHVRRIATDAVYLDLGHDAATALGPGQDRPG
ncbi:hypothetical protein [Nocardioides panaciterrulae]|uniref:Sporulation protein YlmC with PRC-barrel domain n=1 Tax=Nocardioides panaciterrulae TaxID=661492 RepID=A0A7Y9E4N3_9ACTN|nr:hypothetical protein [Nocardioides panaciterrulae]NYD41055.1 sporulation protein YlmC with PRC-barrel domain [Nocardioides panaciterrulae]